LNQLKSQLNRKVSSASVVSVGDGTWRGTAPTVVSSTGNSTLVANSFANIQSTVQQQKIAAVNPAQIFSLPSTTKKTNTLDFSRLATVAPGTPSNSTNKQLFNWLSNGKSTNQNDQTK